ncbi:3'-5' exonuclease [Aquimarina sp. MMG016]|nr:3'-5' exonuclease [Aquimarina sp. MMG016]MBQ4821727.1 3'-5' exonuclease [Aquimarina sp. MMG016]
MLNWLKHKEYPDFWNQYTKYFKDRKNNYLHTNRFVVFDTETTGFDFKKDRVLSIGAISVVGNTMDVADSFEVYLRQEKFDSSTVEIHGILKEGRIHKISEKDAIIQFLYYIKDATLVAHHANFDINMINTCLIRLGLPKLKNKVIDTGILFKNTRLCSDKTKHYTLDELCDFFNIKMHDRHTASGDAYITGIIFLKIIDFLTKAQNITLRDLFYNQKRRGLL